MLKPLVIGNKQFKFNVIQAPLAGVSCAPFRELIWQFGAVAYCCTEMLSALHIANGTDRSPRYQTRASNEENLCWQLSGNNPDILARATAHAIKNHADIVDLNCGCPQPKIRKKGCGSQLLTDEKKLSALVRAIKKESASPVTVKMRISVNPKEFCDVSVAKLLESSGADALIVHGRHWTHDYSIPCQRESIAKIVENVSIPVISNGDISDAAHLQLFFEDTRCAGFMIGRAGVGQPWLFKELHATINQETFVKPTMPMIGKLFLQHVTGLIALEGERNALFQTRKLGKYYARNNPHKNEFIHELHVTDSFQAFEKIVKNYFLETQSLI